VHPISVADMQSIDAHAIDVLGLPRLLLMEHAGLGVARQAAAMVHCILKREIMVCCGTGYNGGDGLCAARHLLGWGYTVHVVVAGSLRRLRAEPAIYARILKRMGITIFELTDMSLLDELDKKLTKCSLILDALVGIGLQEAELRTRIYLALAD